MDSLPKTYTSSKQVDTNLAAYLALASHGTLLAPERRLLWLNKRLLLGRSKTRTTPVESRVQNKLGAVLKQRQRWQGFGETNRGREQEPCGHVSTVCTH